MSELWNACTTWLQNAGPAAVLRLDLLAVLMVALLVPVCGLVLIFLHDRRAHG